MHYSCFVFTKEFPTDDILYKVLAPFNEEDFYNNEETRIYPEFLWDWFKIGGRYSGLLKLSVRKNKDKYDWGFYFKGGRNGKLFRSQLIDTINKFKQNNPEDWMFREEDVYGELGYRDGYIRVDGCPVIDILNRKKLSCYCFVDKNGNAYSCEKWNGENYEKHKDFDEVLTKTIDDSLDCYLTVVDIHS